MYEKKESDPEKETEKQEQLKELVWFFRLGTIVRKGVCVVRGEKGCREKGEEDAERGGKGI